MATMQQIADTVKKRILEAQIDFDWDRSEEMKIASMADSYEMDNTAAREDFGWQPRYPLDEAGSDFVNEVKAGKAGSLDNKMSR